uniref:Scaffold protein Nfu/NifU N-terminal domain-containing protein n=1 Tax=Palpitomonas bilix TaxID=652834 RepID=A0A7S3D5F1_9EUKA|mmetsp:Transcript_21875/g.56805  ORF Transcript_21875/g.56805 Transcript_21875/m.56805 type:complete len:283 (+) Transcript_21875:186-1034(+)
MFRQGVRAVIPAAIRQAGRKSGAPASIATRLIHAGRVTVGRSVTASPLYSSLLTSLRPALPTVIVRGMFIQSRTTPNEHSLMFIPGVPVLGEGNGTLDLPSYKEAQQKSPLGQELFKVDGVRSILLGPDFITVTKVEGDAWEVVKPQVHGIIMDFFQGGKEVVTDHIPSGSTVIHDDDDEVVAMIKELLDTRIRPAVQEDGGDIEYVDFDDEGFVHLRLKGACSTCSSSQVTLKNGVENMLMHYVPEVQGVTEVVGETEEEKKMREASDEMLKKMETKIGTL